MADPAGLLELSALHKLVTGNLGLVTAVGLTAWGAYKILVKAETKFGLILLLVGACLALFGNLLNGVRANFCRAVDMLGGTCATTGNQFPVISTGSGGIGSQ